MVRSAAAMEAGHQVLPDGRPALTAVVTTTTGGSGGGAGGGREPEGLPCPRCESVHTKFCYYNNYNLSQPRHFCKACRRYWTRGGALRNVPVGGGTRKATPAATRRKRTAAASPPSSAMAAPVVAQPPPRPPPAAALHGASLLRPYGVGFGGGGLSFAAPAMASPLAAVDPDRRLLDFGGSFTSLIAPGGPADVGVHFSAGFLVGGLAPGALSRAPASVAALPPSSPTPPTQQQPMVSQALPPEGSVFWTMGCPDLSI